MRIPVRLALAAAGVVLVSGCQILDPGNRYAYGRAGDGLWDTQYDLLLDWRFPTSANQPPVEAPKRFKPELPAIGVPWATGNPMQPRPEKGQAGALEPGAAQTPEPAGNDVPASADVPATSGVANAADRMRERARGARVGG